ncbi:hypothetical protein PAXINDRAFT_19841 [Paxillus involutus ATCC 200175]|uniref:CxC1-like cysteine cluster associated with KDZ transposases domain-containing protein n=1 Tax=Paxillus involutus ATCC 200175 TaxID=664439 RepID=A0A0C9SW30_PAXIN|nr:hypothetical protein PAXINDRAFT_19841 [Paxillus involutus ATCC 200175]
MAVRRPRLAKSRSHSLSKCSSHRRNDDTPEPSTSHLPHVNPFLTAPSSLSRCRLRNTGGLQLLNAPVLVLPGWRRLVQQGRQAQFPGVQGHGHQGDHNTSGDGGPDAHMVNDKPPFSDAVYFPNEDDTSRVPCISNAYHWYIVLVMHNKELVSGIINASSSRHKHETSDSKEEEGGAHEDAKDPRRLQYPSDYLRSRCPLCFGGLNWCKERDSLVDVIVCIDACFTQKCSKNPREAKGHDPLNPTSSVFIPSETVTQMEVHVERCRSKGKERGRRALRPSEDEDRVEEGMRVPASVLNSCGESFVAADEKREKASTHFFADTGLMALLCRHDRVLWLVNMTSAGEKQHYALALIQQLMQHIPDDMRVGLLYDIGCQLERSWRKFKFFADSILSRFHFAISVFHAYGHQWPCQVVYHPQKRQGFGLSDGEGCERLWSALKPLIGPLRVSDYHQCLFVLDLQVRHLDAKSCLGYGNWLARRWSNWSYGILEETLRSEWAAQVVTQTRPAPRQSKHKADEEISKIIELEKLVGARAQMVRSLELRFISNQVHDVESFEIEIADARSQHNNLLETLRRRREGLGVTGRAKLVALRGNVFLQVHMNALAVKT